MLDFIQMNVRNVPQLDPSFFKVQEHIWGFKGRELWSLNSDLSIWKEQTQVVSPIINTMEKERYPVVASWCSLIMAVVVHLTALICMNPTLICETDHLLSGKEAEEAGGVRGGQSWFSIYPLILKGILAHALQPFCSNRPKSQWAESTVWLCPWWGSWSCYTVVCLEELKPCTLGVAFFLFICSLFSPAFLRAGCRSVIAQPAAVLANSRSH